MAAKKQVSEGYQPPLECAYAGCARNALVHVQMPTGWANVCAVHYDRIHLERCHETCRKLGLETVEQKRDWVRRNPLKLKRGPTYQREPGEDLDEEIAA